MKKWFENMKISRKLNFGFMFILFAAVIVGLIGILNLHTVIQHQERSYDESTLGVNYSNKAELAVIRARSLIRDLYIHYDTSSRSQYSDEIKDELAIAEENLAKYPETIYSEQDQRYFDAVETAYKDFSEQVDALLTAAEANRSAEEIYAIIVNSKDVAEELDTAIETIAEYKDNLTYEKLTEDANSAWMSIYLMVGIMVVLAALALFLSAYISGLISKPLCKLAEFSEMMAAGDIAVEKVIEEKDKLLKYRKDEVGALALSFNKMIGSVKEQAQITQQIAEGDLTVAVPVRSEFDVLGKALSSLVEKFHSLAASIVMTANQVDSGAKLVSNSSVSLSQGASEQAGSVEELTASLEEITSQTNLNAQNVQETDMLAREIKTEAEAGNTQMAEMLQAMDEINTSSDDIARIIKVIDGIAFQTNILALNAAVEAARAGTHGKGFAVVAEEVRNLAAQCATAATETSELIENSIKKVENGAQIANDTAASLGKIVSGIAKTSELVDAITLASNEQATALEQINQGIAQVSQVVQGTAAASEECAAASEELSAQADSLKENVSVFKLNINRTSLEDGQYKQKGSSDAGKEILFPKGETQDTTGGEDIQLHRVDHFSSGTNKINGKY